MEERAADHSTFETVKLKYIFLEKALFGQLDNLIILITFVVNESVFKQSLFKKLL